MKYSGDFTEAKLVPFVMIFKQIMEKEDCTALVTGHHATIKPKRFHALNTEQNYAVK